MGKAIETLVDNEKINPPEITQGGFLVGLRNLFQSGRQIGGRSHSVRLCNLGQDLGSLLRPRLGDEPAWRLREHLPGEEEEDERSDGDNLDQPPGSNQPAWDHIVRKRNQIGQVVVEEGKMVLTNKREGDLAKRPGKAGKADDIASENEIVTISRKEI